MDAALQLSSYRSLGEMRYSFFPAMFLKKALLCDPVPRQGASVQELLRMLT